MSLSGLTYTCQDCRRVSVIKNTHNRLGLPSLCPACVQIKAKEQAQECVDTYEDALAKNSAQLDTINKIYKEAATQLNIKVSYINITRACYTPNKADVAKAKV